jgi:DNA polymerase V
MYALVDCNNFFVSCERLFAPHLEKKPVIVLSNCDGCVVSRSPEAKKLGIQMGAPFFQIKALCQQHNVAVFSSNFALYGDLSRRIMHILKDSAPEIEVYSIDEAFLRFSATEPNLYSFCHELKKKVQMWTGIPVSIGIAPTKTLAKVATKMAKKEGASGVFDLRDSSVQDEILTDFPVSDVWGIGRKSTSALQALGYDTALQFRNADTSRIRTLLGVFGEKTMLELQGKPCFTFGELSLKKSILVSRSFDRAMIDTHAISLALSAHVQDACEKLRRQESLARAGEVFIEILQENGPKKYLGSSFYLPLPANDTPTILTIAKETLLNLLRGTMRVKKCGILLFDFMQEEDLPHDLFWKGLDPKKKKLMALVDSLNTRFGKNTLFYASNKTSDDSRRSPRYTTCWNELAVVKA